MTVMVKKKKNYLSTAEIRKGLQSRPHQCFICFCLALPITPGAYFSSNIKGNVSRLLVFFEHRALVTDDRNENVEKFPLTPVKIVETG